MMVWLQMKKEVRHRFVSMNNTVLIEKVMFFASWPHWPHWLLSFYFLGWIYDLTQKYDFSFYICGFLYMVGILTLLIQPYMDKEKPSSGKNIENENV